MTSSLWATLGHVDQSLAASDQPNVLVFHYDDLIQDLNGEMRRLAKYLDIEIAKQIWQMLVEAESFDHMRARADNLVSGSLKSLWKQNQ